MASANLSKLWGPSPFRSSDAWRARTHGTSPKRFCVHVSGKRVWASVRPVHHAVRRHLIYDEVRRCEVLVFHRIVRPRGTDLVPNFAEATCQVPTKAADVQACADVDAPAVCQAASAASRTIVIVASHVSGRDRRRAQITTRATPIGARRADRLFWWGSVVRRSESAPTPEVRRRVSFVVRSAGRAGSGWEVATPEMDHPGRLAGGAGGG